MSEQENSSNGGKPYTITSRPNMKRVPDTLPEREIYYSCDKPGELYVEGYNVSMSDLYVGHFDKGPSASSTPFYSGTFTKFDKLCEKAKPFREVTVFAQNTVELDVPITAKSITHGELQLAIAAPNWMTSTWGSGINLNGANAPHRIPGKAENGSATSIHGKDGLPGLSGEPAGNFFGLAGKIHGTVHVMAIGGEGGRGQDGGDGADAEIQTYAVPSDESTGLIPPCVPKNICENDRMQSLTNKGTIETFECKYHPDHTSFIYKTTPKLGNYAGNGGNGGRSGIGGYGGDVKLYQLTDPHPESILNFTKNITESSNTSKGGKGGKGKKGYVQGRTVSIRIRQLRENQLKEGKKWCEIYTDSEDEKDEVLPADENILPGKDGMDKFVTEGQQRINKTLTLNPAKIVNKYRGFLRGNLERKRRDSGVKVMEDFLQNLDKNDKIRNDSDTLDLVDEFKDIEQQMYTLGSKVDFIPFYESLLGRLIAHAEKYENNYPHRKVISSMFTAAYSRLFHLKENPESLLVLDMIAQLSKFEEQMKTNELKNEKQSGLKRTAEIISALDNEKEKYKEDLDQKIEETKNFRQDMLKDIDSIEKDIESEIKILIEQVKIEMKKSRETTKELKEKCRLLRSQLIWKGFFSTLKFVGQAATFLGPVGIAANTFIQGTSSIVEPLFLGGKTTTSAPTQVPTVITNVQGLVKSVKESRIKPLNEELGKLTKELEKHSSELGELKKIGEETSEIQEDLNKASKIEDIEKIEERLKKQKEVLESKIDRKEHKYEDLVKSLDNLQKISKLGAELYNVCNTIATGQEEIAAVEKAIELEEKAFEGLKTYQKNVHEVLTPILDMVVNDMVSAAGNLDQKSHAALDIAKWNIKKHLSQVETFVSEFTKGKDVQPAFLRTIKELNEAMDVLIGLYHLIQTYKDQKSFSDHLGNLVSTAAGKIQVNDSALQLAQNELEIVLGSNLILQEFQKTIIAFKHFVFPYSDYYFKDIRFLPNKISEEGSSILNWKDDTALSTAPNSRYFDNNYFEEVVNRVSKIVTDLKGKMLNYKNIMDNMRSCLLHGRFDSSDTSYPFYRWKNVKHNSIIGKLLNGDEATLKADIRLSPREYDAIKFTNAKLKFVANDQALQERIDKELRVMKITMTHLGDSYYRYNDEYYKMTTNSINMTYHLKDGGHVGEIYEALSNGSYVLSPYSTWTFQLFPTKTNGLITFDKLKDFSSDIDLVLEGEGRYVEADKPHCLKQNVNDYYKPIELPQLSEDEKLELQESRRLFRRKRSIGTMDEQDDSESNTSSYSWIKERITALLSNTSFSNIKEIAGVADTISTHVNNHPLISPSTQKDDASVTQYPNHFDGNGLLMLTNLLVRKLTGEKYQQAALPSQEKEERLNDIKEQVFSALRDFENDQEKFESDEMNDSFY